MINIVIPMAGRGSRFQQAGFTLPKPLIRVGHVPMIDIVIANLRPARTHRFIFICQREHLEQHRFAERLSAAAPGSEIIALDGVTEGAACTVLTARELIDNAAPVMIANCDQFIDASIDEFLDHFIRSGRDGSIMTMEADNPKWSFVEVDKRGLVVRVAEKRVISKEATTGIYAFRRGCDFVAAANAMISRNERVNNEFYVAPVYNELISRGFQFGIFNIGREALGMYGLGIPEDIELFTQTKVQRRLRFFPKIKE